MFMVAEEEVFKATTATINRRFCQRCRRRQDEGHFDGFPPPEHPHHPSKHFDKMKRSRSGKDLSWRMKSAATSSSRGRANVPT
ncbi:hypothetical protein IMZ48_12960 [Candidatus Bathyarchaeota archaeon]|nr:hypothetical protein [Candidatus Bathyarchaeota archaeon]